jgi:hypothetical protein
MPGPGAKDAKTLPEATHKSCELYGAGEDQDHNEGQAFLLLLDGYLARKTKKREMSILRVMKR